MGQMRKREKFEEPNEKRMNEAIKKIRLINNLSNRNIIIQKST